jgi:hypothetical protein
MPPRPPPSAYEHRQDPGFHRTAERSLVPVPVLAPVSACAGTGVVVRQLLCRGREASRVWREWMNSL